MLRQVMYYLLLTLDSKLQQNLESNRTCHPGTLTAKSPSCMQVPHLLRVAAVLGLAVRHRRRLREVARALCQGHSAPHAQVGTRGRARRWLQETGIDSSKWNVLPSSRGKKNNRAVVVQLMSACVGLWISCTTTKKWPNLFLFPLLGYHIQLEM